jgi:DNA-binding HxlR family transcriptional regulator
MPTKRNPVAAPAPHGERAYRRFCGLSTALDIVGDRWTIHVIYHLLTGPKRYTDLKDYIAGAGSNVVGDRLRLLAAHGIVERTAGHAPGSQVTYRLTDRGRELGPIIRGLALWGLRPLTLATDTEPDEVTYDQKWAIGDAKPPRKETFQWTVDGRELSLVIDGHRLTRRRGRARNPAAVLEISTETLEKVLTGAFTIPEGARRGALRLAGSVEAQRRMFWVTGFPVEGLGNLAR